MTKLNSLGQQHPAAHGGAKPFNIFEQLVRTRPRIEAEPVLPPAKDFVKQATIEVRLSREKSTLEVAPLIERDPYPLPSIKDREGYCGENHWAYWHSGFVDYFRVKEAVELHGSGTQKALKTLDIGCASGRVIRHLACQEPEWEVWGCDIDRINIDWVKRNLPASIRAFQNGIYPHLPLPDGSFDVITAFSVFTHIDIFDDAWLLEIRRLLKKGGIAYITVLSERSWKRAGERKFYQTFWKENLHTTVESTGRYQVSAELFENPMPEDRLVIQQMDPGVYFLSTFRKMDFIKESWGKYLDFVVEYDAGGSGGYQDVIVLRRS